MSSAVLPNENAWDGNDDIPDNASAPKNAQQQNYLDAVSEARKGGAKTLKTSVKQGANLSLNRKLFIERIASKMGGKREDALAMAQRDYSSKVRELSLRIQSQNRNLSIEEAKLEAEQQILSRPNYINSIVKDRLKKIVGDKAKDLSKTVAKGVAKNAARALLANPIVLVVILVCCIVSLLVFILVKTATSDAQFLFTEAPQLVHCAGLPADIENPTAAEVKKIFDCSLEQKNQEYSSSDPIPE